MLILLSIYSFTIKSGAIANNSYAKKVVQQLVTVIYTNIEGANSAVQSATFTGTPDAVDGASIGIILTGNATAATGDTRNGASSNATGDADGVTTEIGASTDYLVLTLADELPIGTDYTIHISGRNGSATSDVFEAPDGTSIPGSQQNSPAGFTQNGQATGADGVITEVTKTSIVATKYLYFDRGSGDIEIDAVEYDLGGGGGGSGSNCTGSGTVISNVDVPDASNADGVPNGTFASLYQAADAIVMDLGEVLSATTTVTITYQRVSSSVPILNINASTSSNSGFATVAESPYTINTGQGVTATFTVTVPAGNQYLQIESDNGIDAGIDGITFTCPNGGGGTVTGNLPCAAGITEIAGVVFEDFNYNGDYDTGEYLGVDSVIVTATDSLGNSFLDTTVTNGDYSIIGLVSGRTYRIEFTNIPSWASPTFYGGDNGTLVQFIQPGNCANLGVAEPSDYCGITNPDIVLACYENGDGSSNTNVSMLRYKYNNDGIPAQYSGSAANPTQLSTIAQIGTVWGADYNRTTETAYVTAFLKRHVSLGPLGLGGVYMVNPTTGYLGSFDLQGVTPNNGGAAISFGSITRSTVSNQISSGSAGNNQLSQNTNEATIDLDAFTKIATTGMGDTDIEHDANKLWTINLNTSEAALISIDLNDNSNPIPTNGAQPSGAIVNRYLISSMSPPSCTNGVFRPWALGFNKGKGYVGGVCSAENGGTTNDLKAYLLSFDPANPAGGFIEVVSFDLDFNRELKSDFGDHQEDSDWRPWANTWSDIQFNNGRYANYATPIFSDIEFRENGDLILGFMDRYSHQLGYQQYEAVSASQNNGEYDTESAGDIYHVCLVNGNYVTEGLAGCADSDVGTPVNSSLTNDGINSMGEYYWEDMWQYSGGSSGHNETASGALSILKGTGIVLSSSLDPVNGDGGTNASTQGSVKFNTATGAKEGSYMIIDRNGTDLGKSGGLSDLVVICNPAPIEIGNYIWLDTDSDGIQDAGEAGLEGIRMELYDVSGVLLAFDTTNTLGQYYFSGTGIDDATWLTSNDTLMTNTNYYIVAGGNGQYGANGLSINGTDYTLTTANANSNNSDEIDSDGTIAAGIDPDFDGEPYVQITTGNIGEVDHSFDFGFVPIILPLQCNCTEYVYLNDEDVEEVHKFSIAGSGSLSEVGSPWLGAGTITNPHGLAMDNNGYLYIGQLNSLTGASGDVQGPMFQLACDGTVLDNDFLNPVTQFGFNIGSDNGVIYNPNSVTNTIEAYSSCDGSFLGAMHVDNGNDIRTWGFYVENGNWYLPDRTSGDVFSGSLDLSLYADPPVNSGASLFSTGLSGNDGALAAMGLTRDSDGNYFIVFNRLPANTAVPEIRKYSPSGSLLTTITDNTSGNNSSNGQSGFWGARGITYSPESDYLYVSNLNNCITVFDTNLNEITALNIGNPLNTSPKGIGIAKECCPINGNTVVDTTLCTTSVNDLLYLQDFLSCEGTICEGIWTPGGSNTGLTYNSCDNSIRIDALTACGTFTLESDGTGNNPQCGAFKITVNIDVENITAPVIDGNQLICAGGDPIAFTEITPAASSATIVYQWQSSADSLSGYTDIVGATSALYDPPSSILYTIFYRVIANTTGGCSSGNCADTSNILKISVMNCAVYDYGDLPDVADGTTGINDYETYDSTGGPSHQIIVGLFLGDTVDAELDGYPDSLAVGDDTKDGYDDEDGIAIFPSLNIAPGGAIRLPLVVTNTTGDTAYIEAWIDWNGDGDFDELNEIVADYKDEEDGVFPAYMDIMVPDDAVTGSLLGFRVRLRNTDNMTPYGRINSGEVEDYLLGIDCPQVICLPIEIEVIKK